VLDRVYVRYRGSLGWGGKEEVGGGGGGGGGNLQKFSLSIMGWLRLVD